MIVTHGLTKHFGKTLAVDDLSFTVTPGVPLREVGALLDAKAFHPGRSARNHLRCLARTNDISVVRVRRGARHRRAHCGGRPPDREVLARHGAAPRHRRRTFLSLLALFGLGIGAIIRHSAGAIATFVGCTLLVPLLLHNLGNPSKFMPVMLLGNSVAAVVPVFDASSSTAALLLMALYTAIALGVGAAALSRRDA
jgi:hypothetical protein